MYKLFSRTGLICAVLAVVASAWSQSLEKKISFDGAADRAAIVLGELSKIAGVSLRTGSGVHGDVIALRFKDATVAEVMKKIADTLDGEWAQESDGWRLVRSETIRLKQQRMEVAERAKLLSKSLNTMLESAKLDQPFDKEVAKKIAGDSTAQFDRIVEGQGSGGGRQMRQAMRNFQASNSQQPGGRAILRLLSNMKMEDLAAAGPGTRTVFSTNPTSVQRRLGNNSQSVIKQFYEEQREFDQAMSEAMANRTSSAGGGQFIFSGIGPRNREPNLNAVPTKGLLIATRFGNSDALSFQLVVADQNGEYIAQGNLTLGVTEFDEPVSAGEAKADESPIELSQLSKEFIEIVKSASPPNQGGDMVFIAVTDDGDGAVTLMGNGAENAPAVKLSKEWKERLTNPDKFEPMSTVPSDIFRGYSLARGENMVALLPDDLLMRLTRRLTGGGSLKPSEVLSSLAGWDLNQRMSDGWALISPQKPNEVRDMRLDRAALGNMYRTLNSTGRLTLDDLAANAIAQPEFNSPMAFDEFFTALLDPSSSDQSLMRRFGNQLPMLRFYGSLGSGQKSALKNGQPLPYNSFNPKQRQLLHSMVFNSMDGPRIEQRGNRGGGRESVEMQVEVRNGFAMMAGGNLRTERTEALGAGIPVTTLLNLNIDREQAVLASAPNGRSQVLDAEGIARQKVSAEMPQLAQFSRSQPYDKFQRATQSNYNFTFRMNPAISLSRQLRDNDVDTASSAVAYDALPADFRRRVDRAYDRMKQMMSNIRVPGVDGSGGGGRQIPPSTF